MNISITFRHMEASEAIKGYARDKLAKLQKFLRKPMTAKVTLSLDKLRHVAETRISSGGEHLEAKETSEDMYASIDRVLDKLERQIRGSKGAARAKKRRGGDSLRAPARSEIAARTSGDGVAAKRRKRPAGANKKSR
jgi:putative sigma-54 modulation protein